MIRGAVTQELLDLLREALYHETSWSEAGERNINWGQALTAGAGLGANLALSFLGPGAGRRHGQGCAH